MKPTLPAYYAFTIWSSRAAVDWSVQLRQDAADIDRPAAEAEDRERDARKKFTADDIKPGFRYTYQGDLRTVIEIYDGKFRDNALYGAIDARFEQYVSGRTRESFADLLNAHGDSIKLVAP